MEKLKSILNARESPVMGIYLKLLAFVLLGFAGLHFANLLGYGDVSLEKMLPAARLAHILYAQFFAITAVGLWKLTSWGVACFLMGAISQIILYWGVPEYFTQVIEGQQAFQGIINIHISLLAIFCLIRIKGK
ncbi:MAG: hypothetical protein ACE5F7_05540 [Nitrospiria bacterium]